MFSIRLWKKEKFHADMIGIKCNFFDITVTYKLKNEELNSVISPFVLRMVFQDVGLLWIIKYNKRLRFEMNV